MTFWNFRNFSFLKNILLLKIFLDIKILIIQRSEKIPTSEFLKKNWHSEISDIFKFLKKCITSENVFRHYNFDYSEIWKNSNFWIFFWIDILKFQIFLDFWKIYYFWKFFQTLKYWLFRDLKNANFWKIF